MPRTRNIKPGFFRNEDLARCSTHARLAFLGLWCLADCEGRLEDRPERIRAELFPYEAVNMDALLEELEQYEFIQRYETEGGRYIWVINFGKHQNPHPHERKKGSLIPPPQPGVQRHPQVQKTSLISNAAADYPANPATVTCHDKSVASPADYRYPITDSRDPDTPITDIPISEGRVRNRHSSPTSVGSIVSGIGIGVSTSSSGGIVKEALGYAMNSMLKLILTINQEPDWQPWWREVLRRLSANERALGEFVDVLEYVTDCMDPTKRRAKDLGELRNPAGYLFIKTTTICKNYGIRWPRKE